MSKVEKQVFMVQLDRAKVQNSVKLFLHGKPYLHNAVGRILLFYLRQKTHDTVKWNPRYIFNDISLYTNKKRIFLRVLNE